MSENTLSARPMVLIIDDEPTNITSLAELLKSRFRIKAAKSAEQASVVLSSGPLPDIILLDIVMPGMNGYQLCRKLKSDQRYKNIPIIFITVKDSEEDEILGLEAGAADYISKPFNGELVQHRIDIHLERKKYQENLADIVNIRTAELLKTNNELERVIAMHKKTQRKLTESEQRYKGVLDNSGMGIAVISRNMEVLSINKQLQSQFPPHRLFTETYLP